MEVAVSMFNYPLMAPNIHLNDIYLNETVLSVTKKTNVCKFIISLQYVHYVIYV